MKSKSKTPLCRIIVCISCIINMQKNFCICAQEKKVTYRQMQKNKIFLHLYLSITVSLRMEKNWKKNKQEGVTPSASTLLVGGKRLQSKTMFKYRYQCILHHYLHLNKICSDLTDSTHQRPPNGDRYDR